MMLPESLLPNALGALEIPGDITLGQVRATFTRSTAAIEAQSLIAEIKPTKALFIRFVNLDDEDMPDDLTMEAFRVLVKAGKARIIIEEGDGGAKASTPELVD